MEANQTPWEAYQAPVNKRIPPAKVAKTDKKLQARGAGDVAKKKRLQRPHAYIGDRAQKGLRQFSIKVSRKVKTKGSTSYNQVADELVEEFLSDPARKAMSEFDQAYDDKNIRRRVYDALNVLEAIGIIRKGEKKQIHWSGHTVMACEDEDATQSIENKDTPESLEAEIVEREAALDEKRKKLRAIWEEYIVMKNVQNYNRANESQSPDDVVTTPFSVLSCDSIDHVDCQMMHQSSVAIVKGPKAWTTTDVTELQKSMNFHVASPSLQKEWSHLPAFITGQQAWPSTPEGKSSTSNQIQATKAELSNKDVFTNRVTYQNVGAAMSYCQPFLTHKGIVQANGKVITVKEEKPDLSCDEMLAVNVC